MKKIILLLVLSVLFSCASPEHTALRQEIITSAPEVKTHLPNSADWCQAEQKCRYLRNILCGGATEEECLAALKRDTIKLGGDTVVVQEIKPYIGNRGKVLVYAQGYNCENKFSGIGNRYQVTNPTRLKRVRYLSSDYAKKCNIATTCKSVAPFECSENNWNPARLCLRTIDSTYTDLDFANALVFETETFTEHDDNGRYQRGDYLLSGPTYNCKMN